MKGDALGGFLILAIIVVVVVWGMYWDAQSEEIGASEYYSVYVYAAENPDVYSHTMKCMEDNRITRREYNQLIEIDIEFDRKRYKKDIKSLTPPQ